MDTSKEVVLNIIFQVMDEENELKVGDEKLIKSIDTALLSRDGVLDSMGLVNFIVSTEEKISDYFNKNITIADARAMSQKNSPFRTAGSLADHIVTLLNENA